MIAICSDIHDYIRKLATALPGINDANLLRFRGGFSAPFTLAQMVEGLDKPVHCVLGNNDGYEYLLSQVAAMIGNGTLHGELHCWNWKDRTWQSFIILKFPLDLQTRANATRLVMDRTIPFAMERPERVG